MKKRMLIMILVVFIFFGLLFRYKMFEKAMIGKYMASMGAPVQTISTTKATLQDWQPNLSAVGSMRAVNGSDLSSEVAGIVETISFESGTDVEKGAALVQLRAEDDIAKLQSLQATARLADITVARDMKQIAVQAISQAALDSDRANLDSDRAQVAEQQAIVDKKTIRAPFAGHLGIREVDMGQYLQPGTAIVTLQQLDPIYIDFTLPEQALPQLAVGRTVTATANDRPDEVYTGEISSINSRVDEATRNIQVRATFKNPDHKLLPGMFASVSLETGAPVRNITLPATAITYNPYGDTVFLVDNSTPDKPVAKQTFVTVGLTRGDQVAITKGVHEGDEVVTSGQIKLRNGTPVKVNNEIQPTNDQNPKPEDR